MEEKESKCVQCKYLFTITAKAEDDSIFSRSTCLVDSQCFELLWQQVHQVFTVQVGDALVPFVEVCSHWECKSLSTVSNAMCEIDHVEG